MEASPLRIGSQKLIRCNVCNLQTHHELKAIHIRQQEEEYDTENPNAQPSWVIEYEYLLWACLGCDTAILEEIVKPDFMIHATSTYYPSRKFGQIKRKEFYCLGDKLHRVYCEVVESYNAGLNVLCALGLRSLLEGICVNKGITDDAAFGLESKLGKLDELGLLPPNVVESLFSFKFIGDDAAHRLEPASQEELKLSIEVMEDLLSFLYEAEFLLASKAQRLGENWLVRLEEIKLKKKKSRRKMQSA